MLIYYNNHMNKPELDQEAKLNQRLSIIKKYYDLDALLAHGTKQQDIAKYYRKSDFFYNHVHSGGGGNIHMAISSDHTFNRADFVRQAEYVAKFIKSGNKVLEVGAGHYHDLKNLEDNSFDVIFGVETICYSQNKQLVVSEIMKKLKPGGTFITFDVFEPKPRSEMSDFEKRISSITLAGMRVTDLDQYIGDFKKYLKESGAKDIEITDLTENIMPNLKRLAKISRLYYTHPLLLRVLKTVLAEDVTINSVTGFLMDLTFDGKNIHAYYRVTAKK